MRSAEDAKSAPRRPEVNTGDAERIFLEFWGLAGEAKALPGDRDMNFCVHSEAGRFALKITDATDGEIALSVAALDRLASSKGALQVGQAVASLCGSYSVPVQGGDGRPHLAWAVAWVDGTPLAQAGDRSPGLVMEIGQGLGLARAGLEGWDHPGLDRDLKWDLRKGLSVAWSAEASIPDPTARRVVRETLAHVELRLAPLVGQLRVGVIHGDGNDHNILVAESAPAARPCGLIDVGDIDRGWVASECAIAAAYLMLEEGDPISTLADFVGGYHSSDRLTSVEVSALYDLARLRLCVSVCIAAEQRAMEPENQYLSVTAAPALELLKDLMRLDADKVVSRLLEVCGYSSSLRRGSETAPLLMRRERVMPPSLSISYRDPLDIVRGEGRYLFDRDGRAFLDCVNNVAHVGHCHPAVVGAASAQMATLNTNSRYLSDVRIGFCELLASTLPEALEVVFLVNSGSEANELAMRLARAHTKGSRWIVLDAAYHGNTEALVALSPYKFKGPGGAGVDSSVHVAELPDRYRGRWGYEDPDAGERYASDVERCTAEIADEGAQLAALFAESISGCGGQVVYPPGYLAAAATAARAAGGVVVADEVQVGCGRVGTHWWAFEAQGMTPDIVTIGKPLGGGHPVGAVVTTKEIAQSFDSGMEFFNTFGGNPVSCATAAAVLGVVEEERLRENVCAAGDVLICGLRDLAARSDRIGDVRGVGLFVGFVLVKGTGSDAPDAALASEVVECARGRGVLLSTDGPLHDVIKIKPPIVFTPDDSAHLIAVIESSLLEAVSRLESC